MPRAVGARPGHPLRLRVGSLGQNPIQVSVQDLPDSLEFDPARRLVTGMVPSAGIHPLRVSAVNARDRSEVEVQLIFGPAIGLTPPMGWNSWNAHGPTVDDRAVRAAAHALRDSGLADHGWTHVNIDDGWQGARDSGGRLRPNAKFPDLAELGASVHDLGLSFGIYSSPGRTTCEGFEGSFEHETDDAASFANWGVDYLKYDWCSYEAELPAFNRRDRIEPYTRMGDALAAVPRDIVYSVCQYGHDNVWEWAAEVGANCWRTTGDIVDTWDSVSTIGFSQSGLEPWAGPGRWNDPDMLVVGKVGWGRSLRPTRLTLDEQRSTAAPCSGRRRSGAPRVRRGHHSARPPRAVLAVVPACRHRSSRWFWPQANR